jgi:hypothetical protein
VLPAGDQPNQKTKMTPNTITESARTFAQTNWPESGPVWVRVDQWGNALGWAVNMDECQARQCRAEVATAKAQWGAANIGDFVTVPTGFHPRHGIKTATFCRVR